MKTKEFCNICFDFKQQEMDLTKLIEIQGKWFTLCKCDECNNQNTHYLTVIEQTKYLRRLS